MEEKSGTDGDGPFPPEVISEVLLRLPVKSLCGFRCVSHLWRSIISDPHFVSSHFARSAAHPKLLIAMDERKSYEVAMRLKGNLFFSVDYPESPEDLRLAASYRGRINSSTPTFSHPVGGLICIRAGKRTQICNPSTGESVTFSTPSAGDGDCCRSNVYLGYYPVEKKHKILNSWATAFNGPMVEAQVLTFGDKDWKRVDLGHSSMYFGDDSICIDGVIYFVGVTERFEVLLVAFDVRLETFREAPFPAEAHLHKGILLTEFRGRAALINYQEVIMEGLDALIRLWILEDHHAVVWSLKQFVPSIQLKDTLSDLPCSLIGVTHEAELILAPPLSVKPFHWYFYHLEHSTMRKIEICGLYDHEHALTRGQSLDVKVHCHVESSQSLRGICMD